MRRKEDVMKKAIKISKGLLTSVIIHKKLITMKILNIARYSIFILAIFLGTVVTANAASGLVVNLNYMEAATAKDYGPQDGVFDLLISPGDPNFGNVNNNGYTSWRTALEFDIPTFPTGSIINSATLTLYTGVFAGPRQVQLHGYVGDGDISLSDFALDGLVDITTLCPIGGQTMVFDVQSFVAGLVANGDPIAGFNLREECANTGTFHVMHFNMTGIYEPILSIEFTTAAAVDITPQTCPNPLNVNSKGHLPVAILGTEDFDVSEIDPDSILLEDMPPLHWEMEDVATPNYGCLNCTAEGPDGMMDLTLFFDIQAIVGVIGPVSDGDCLVLTVTGTLLDGTPIEGSDIVAIRKKKD